MREYFIVLCCLVINLMTMSVIYSQTPESYTVTTINNPSPGYLFLDPLKINTISFIDNSGINVHETQIVGMTGTYYNLKMQPNGLLTFFLRNQTSGTGYFYIANNLFEIIDSIACTSEYITDFHDFQILSNGNYLLIGSESRKIDMSQIVDGGFPNADVIGYNLQEFNSQHNLVWEWNTFDHFQITDAAEGVPLNLPRVDPFHCNSVCQDIDGNIVLSSRHMDEVTKINHTSGTIIWRMGGTKCKNNQFSVVNDSRDNFIGFSHQHDIQILSNGHLLLFDNGNLKTNQYSRGVEYQIDENSKTATRVWEYLHTPDIYSNSQGSVQRMTNGNSLIGWGDNSQNLLVTEIDRDSKTVFEMEGTAGISSYRAYRFVFNMQSVTRNITNRTTYNFNDYNDQTHINLSVESLTGSGDVTIEAHDYKAHNESFKSPSPLEIVPARWVLSSSTVTGISGKMTFTLDSRLNNSDSSKFAVYWRAKEGEGQFERQTTTYNTSTKILEAQFMGLGEYIIGILGVSPEMLLPINNLTDLSVPVQLQWKKLLNADSYGIQVSLYPSFYVVAFEKYNITDTSLSVPDLANLTKFYWRINAVKNNITTEWSEPWAFTTQLPSPILTAPLDSSMNIASKGTFYWTKVLKTNYYKILISERDDFSDSNISDISASNDYFFKGLHFNKRYYWKVASVNGSTTSNWSVQRTFVTSLDNVLLEYPYDKSIELNPKSITLSWKSLEGATHYQLEISNDSSFNNIIRSYNSLKDTFLIEKSLIFNKKYFWRVSGNNNVSIGEWSSIYEFSTSIGPPQLLLPLNKESNVNINGFLKWDIVDGTQFYHLQVSNENDFINNIIDKKELTDASYKFSNFDYDKKYFWRVLIITSQGKSVWSDTWEFQTRQEFFIEKPTIKSLGITFYNQPLNGNLEWEATPGAITYNLQLSDNIGFNENIINSENISTISIEYSDLLNNTLYFWRVKAIGAKAESEWSNIDSFFTVLESPVLLFPENTAINVKMNTVFKWNPVDGATEYILEFARDEGFYIRSDKSVSFNQISDIEWLNSFTKYYWRVRAIGGQKEGSWSEVWQFTTDKMLGIDDLFGTFNDIVISPNPADKYTNFDIFLDKEGFYKIFIFNNEGVLVDNFSEKFYLKGKSSISWSVSNLISGIYFIVVSDKYSSISREFIISK